MVSSRLLADDQQRSDKPDQQCQGKYQAETPHPAFPEEASGFEEKGLHISSSLKIHMIHRPLCPALAALYSNCLPG